jgi:hypothetical protein
MGGRLRVRHSLCVRSLRGCAGDAMKVGNGVSAEKAEEERRCVPWLGRHGKALPSCKGLVEQCEIEYMRFTRLYPGIQYQGSGENLPS